MDNFYDEKKILARDNDLFIYKLSSVTKDVKRMFKLLQKQTDTYLSTWGTRYSLKECGERLKLVDKGEILICAVVWEEETNGNKVKRVIGLVGYNYQEKYVMPIFNNCYFSHVLIDMKCQGKGFAKRSMLLLLDYLKNKFVRDRIYAGIYTDNDKSIILHKKIGFELEKIENDIVVLSYKLR